MSAHDPGPSPASTPDRRTIPGAACLRRRGRVLAVTVLSAAAAAAAVAVPAGATATSAVPLCTAGQLRPAFRGGQGAAGHLYLTYHFTNVGGTCHTRGWVGALLFGTDGRPLPTHLSRVGGAATLTLAHNATASWAFGYVNPAMLGCRPPASSALIITPPDSATPVLQTRSFSPCNGQFAATGLQAGG